MRSATSHPAIRSVVPGRALALLLLLAWVLTGPAAAARALAPQDLSGGATQDPRAELPVVQRVRIEGQKRYTADQLVAALGQGVGEPLDPAVIDDGLKRLWRSFRVRAAAEIVELPGSSADGRALVELVVRVSELPSDREPRFVGNTAVDTKTLKRWALIEDRTELFLHQARRVRFRLLEGYRGDGYYWAEVNIVTRGESVEEAALSDVIFEIREGPRVRVKAVEFEGNDSMPDRRRFLFFREGLSSLSKRELKSPGIFNWFGSPFVPEKLGADILSMRKVYRDRGWLDAVVEIDRLEFNAARSGVKIHVAVDEGPRYRVGKVAIEAYDPVLEGGRIEKRPAELLIPEAELLEKCRLKPGVFFEQTGVGADQNMLRLEYGKLGHLSHPSLRSPPFPPGYNWEFDQPTLVFDVENHTVDVVYRLQQGRRLTLNEISFPGASHTRDRVLRREVSVFPGALADINEINRSLTRIQGTGFFSDEFNRLEHRDPFYRFLPVEGNEDAVDLVFEVEEGRVIDFSVTGGVDTNEGAFGLLTLSIRNFDATDLPRSVWSTFSELYDKEAFHGAGQQLDIEISPGTAISRYRIHFQEPDIFQLHLNPVSLDLDLTQRVRRFQTHDEDRLAASVRLGRKLTQNLTTSIGYSYQAVKVDNLDAGGVPPLLETQSMVNRTILSGPTFDVSYRDLDNFISPHKGYSVRWNNYLTDESLGADAEFVTSQVHWDAYRPVGAKADGSAITLHLEVDAGVANPYGDTSEIPYSERFFLGGARTVRGFDFRGIGPFDPASGEPLGGETYLSGSIELFYPLHSVLQPGTYRRQEMLRLIGFVDYGLLDVDPFALEPDDLRASVGVALGLAYPLPLSLNFGFPVLKQDGDQEQVFSFSLAFL